MVEKNRVLLRFHPKLGKWLPPGGHLELGETPDEALIREFREETGLIVELIDVVHLPQVEGVKKELAVPFYVNVHSVGDHDHCCLFYRCRIVKRVEEQREPAFLRWFDLSALHSYDIPQDVKHIVELATRRS
ncbi:MAG: NUDIX hydrolase [Candidatus Methanomethyliaceae archaeon]